MKVYLATRGSYSDYSIEAIFSSKRKANTFIKYFPSGEWNDIEEYELDPTDWEIVKKNIPLWDVIIEKETGNISSIEERTYNYYEIQNPPVNVIWHCHNLGSMDLRTYVFAKTKEKAIKIANERRTGFIISKNEVVIGD